MHLYQIEKITIEPLLVIAEDYDHAAEILAYSLVNGLLHTPDAGFEVTKWRIKRGHQDRAPWSWVKDGNAGMVYSVDEGGWEFVHTNMIRDLER